MKNPYTLTPDLDPVDALDFQSECGEDGALGKLFVRESLTCVVTYNWKESVQPENNIKCVFFRVFVFMRGLISPVDCRRTRTRDRST